MVRDWFIPLDTMLDLQAVDESAMDSSCRLGRRGRESVAGRPVGTGTVVWGDPIPCRVSSVNPGLEGERLPDRQGWTATALAAFPLGTGVEFTDLVEVTTHDRSHVWEAGGEPTPGTFATSERLVLKTGG